MKTRREVLKLAGGVGCGLFAGCTTGYDRAKNAEVLVREAGTDIRTVSLPPRVFCAQRAFRRKGLNPSKLQVLISASGTSVGPMPGGHVPQDNYWHDVVRVVHALGFTTVLDLQKAPAQYQYIVQATVSDFVPLSQSSLGRDDMDLVVVAGQRERLMARGSVACTAIVQAFDGRQFSTWTTAKAEGVFYQLKHKREISAINKTGWTSAGTLSEVIEVSAVQKVASLVIQDAVVTAWSDAFELNC